MKIFGKDYTFNGFKVWHKGNQGHNSELDADTLDGKHAADFANSAHSHVKSDVELGNVDNTSDANKPISTLTQAALDTKLTKLTHQWIKEVILEDDENPVIYIGRFYIKDSIIKINVSSQSEDAGGIDFTYVFSYADYLLQGDAFAYDAHYHYDGRFTATNESTPYVDIYMEVWDKSRHIVEITCSGLEQDIDPSNLCTLVEEVPEEAEFFIKEAYVDANWAEFASYASRLRVASETAGEDFYMYNYVYRNGSDSKWYKIVAGAKIPIQTQVGRFEGESATKDNRFWDDYVSTQGSIMIIGSGTSGVRNLNKSCYLRGSISGGLLTFDGTITTELEAGYDYLRIGICRAESFQIGCMMDGNVYAVSVDANGIYSLDGNKFSININGVTDKTTLVDADVLPVSDSEATWKNKKVTWSNIKSTLKTYFDTLYNKYTLPTASSSTLGGVKVGSGLSISNGVLSADSGSAGYFVKKQQAFTTTAGQTTFNLTGGSYTPNTNSISWFLNGVKQLDSELTESSSTQVQINAVVPTGSHIMFEYYEIFSAEPFPAHGSTHIEGGGDAIPVATTAKHGLMSKTDKSKLDGVATGASKVENSSTNGNIKINGTEASVYSHPANHPPSIITQDANNRFVTDTEKTSWNNKPDTDTVYTHPENHPPSIISQDASNRFVTDTEKSTWNEKQKQITSGTANPSGGANGDVYIKV